MNRSNVESAHGAQLGSAAPLAGPCVAIMGHVGVGNLGDEAIISAVVARFRERAPNLRLMAFTLNPRDTAARHGIPAYPLRLYTERLLREPPPDFSWAAAYAAKSAVPRPDGDANTGLAGWIRRRPLLTTLLRPGVVIARGAREALAGLAFDSRSWRKLRGVKLLMWAGSGQVSDYVDGSLGYPLVILRWSFLARLRGAKVAFASSGAGPVTKPLSRLFIGAAVRLSHYRAFRDPYSLEEGRSLRAPEPNLLVRDLAFSSPLLARNGAPRSADAPLSIGINPLPFYGGEYWHVLSSSVYDRYVTAHAELAVALLRRGHRVTLFPTNIRVDPRCVRRVVERVADLGAEVASRLEVERGLRDVPDLFARLRTFDLVVATRYHGVLLSLACGTPAVAVVYHEKTRQVAEHMGFGEWCVDATAASGTTLIERVESLIGRLDEARAVVAARRAVDVPSLLEQFDHLAAMAGAGPAMGTGAP